MRIAYSTISENPEFPSGSLAYFSEMTRLLSKSNKNFDFYLITTVNGKNCFKFCSPNVNLMIVGKTNNSRIKRLFIEQLILPWLMYKHKIDILFTSSGGGVAPLLISTNTMILLGVFATHHLKTNLLDWKVRLYRSIFFTLSIKKASAILTNSLFCKQEILSVDPNVNNKIKVVYHGIDKNVFNNSPLSEEERIFIHNFNLKKEYILFVSTIYQYKNLHTLVEAFCKVTRNCDKTLELVIIGEFEKCFANKFNYKENLINIAKKYGKETAVRFLGAIEKAKLRPFYKNAMIYIQPSLYETFGKTVIEAMACGCPVIGANTSSTTEIIGTAGLLFNPFDTNELSILIEQILENENFRQHLINLGIQRASKFSIEKEAMEVSEIFDQMILKKYSKLKLSDNAY